MQTSTSPRPLPSPQGLSRVHVGASYTDEEIEFLRAMEAYRAIHRRRYPSFTEVLSVARSLGYRKIAPPEEPYRSLGGR